MTEGTEPGGLGGVISVVQTPFDDNDEIDPQIHRRQIDWLFAEGTDGVVTGMVSEVLRLSSDERDELAGLTCEAADGRGPVILSVGAESTATAVRHARYAAKAGASAVMAVPPALTAVDDDELFGYFTSIAAASGLPVVVQDASGYVGRSLSIELQARLFWELGELALFKPESPPIGPAVTALREATDGGARIFEGTGGLHLIDSFRRGAIGTMPAGDLVWAMVPLWQALRRGDYDRAYEIGAPLAMVITLQSSLDTFVSIEKHNLVRQGIFETTRMRGPVGTVGDAITLAEVDRLVDRLRSVVDAGK
jgi:4-hydroxy-tetrahydrodipicolinate synthase